MNMAQGRDLAQFFRQDLWAVDLAERGPLGRLAIRLLRLAVVIWSEFQEHALTLRAASLVYSTLLSLVPFLAVAFSLLKAFGAHYEVEPFLVRLLEPLGPQAVGLTHQVVEFVNNLRVGVLGVVGLAGLFLTVISLIEKVESAFNHIWRVRRARSYGRMFSDYLSVVLVGPVLIFTAFGLIASAESHWLVRRLLAIGPVGAWFQPVAHRVVPFVFLCIAFTFLYRFIPNTSVRLDAALVGGAAAAFLWQLAGVAFTSLLANSPQYVGIYSGFAVLILFLIWLQFAWLVLLVGAIVAYVYQHPAIYGAPRRRPSHSFREYAALAALVEVTRRHLGGERPAGAAELAAQLNTPLSVMEDLLDEFVRRGVLLKSAEPDGVALARAPERVTVTEALEAVRGPDSTEPAVFSAVSETLRRRDQVAREALQGRTLRTLAEDRPTLPAHDVKERAA